MIYIFQDEFKYVIERRAWMMAAWLCVMVVVTLDSGDGWEDQLV